MNKLQQDVERAQLLADLPDEFYKDDVKQRLEEVQGLRWKYRVANNAFAAELFAPHITGLRQALSKARRGTRPRPVVSSSSQPLQSDDVLQYPTQDASLEERAGLDEPEQQSEQVEHLRVYTTKKEERAVQASTVIPALDTRHIFGESKIIDKLLEYTAARGVIGEQGNIILAALCLTNGLHVGIEGPSGSGKSQIANTLIDLMPKEAVYRLELCTESVLMNNTDAINGCNILYVPELQKPYKGSGAKTPMIAEIIKTLTEGRDATRKVTVKPGEVVEYTIYAGIAVMYTLADENAFKKDDETARRFIRLQTDTSEEHKSAVRDAKAQAAFHKQEQTVDVQSEAELRSYMEYLVHHHDEFEVRDPFAAAIREYIPLTQRSASYQSHYNNLVAAAARFNHNRRYTLTETRDGKNTTTVFTTLEDHQLVFSLYHEQMLSAMEQIDRSDADQQKISAVRERLEHEKGVQWDACYAHAKALMTEHFPDHVQRWEQKQLMHHDTTQAQI